MGNNMKSFLKENIKASDRKVLFAKWIGQAWQQSARCQQEAVARLFVKCRITVPMGRNWDSKVSIKNLSNYKVSVSHDDEVADFFSSSIDESSDDDCGEDEESSEFSSELSDTS